MVPQRKLCRTPKDVTVGAIAAAFALLLIIFLDLRRHWTLTGSGSVLEKPTSPQATTASVLQNSISP